MGMKKPIFQRLTLLVAMALSVSACGSPLLSGLVSQSTGGNADITADQGITGSVDGGNDSGETSADGESGYADDDAIASFYDDGVAVDDSGYDDGSGLGDTGNAAVDEGGSAAGQGESEYDDDSEYGDTGYAGGDADAGGNEVAVDDGSTTGDASGNSGGNAATADSDGSSDADFGVSGKDITDADGSVVMGPGIASNDDDCTTEDYASAERQATSNTQSRQRHMHLPPKGGSIMGMAMSDIFTLLASRGDFIPSFSFTLKNDQTDRLMENDASVFSRFDKISAQSVAAASDDDDTLLLVKDYLAKFPNLTNVGVVVVGQADAPAKCQVNPGDEDADDDGVSVRPGKINPNDTNFYANLVVIVTHTNVKGISKTIKLKVNPDGTYIIPVALKDGEVLSYQVQNRLSPSTDRVSDMISYTHTEGSYKMIIGKKAVATTRANTLEVKPQAKEEGVEMTKLTQSSIAKGKVIASKDVQGKMINVDEVKTVSGKKSLHFSGSLKAGKTTLDLLLVSQSL